jgi:hypothetical protein
MDASLAAASFAAVSAHASPTVDILLTISFP